MPTYEYKCSACDYTFERFQSITADPIKRCPECGKSKVKRLLGTGAGVIFKGSGFYTTDYRDKGYAEKAKAESGGGTSSGDAKSDSKPATDANAKPATTTSGAESSKPESKPESKSESKSSSKSESKSDRKK